LLPNPVIEAFGFLPQHSNFQSLKFGTGKDDFMTGSMDCYVKE